jgi:hypothetical protein
MRSVCTASDKLDREQILLIVCDKMGIKITEGKRDAGVKGKATTSVTNLSNFCLARGLRLEVHGDKDELMIFYTVDAPVGDPLPEEFMKQEEDNDPPF